MLLEEAKWLGRQLRKLPVQELSPLCNLGSASEEYRKLTQPYIEQEIFAPARERGINVLHVDERPQQGVDLTGDLMDPAFRERLIGVKFRTVMCCNLLEHVTEPSIVCRTILSMLPATGYAIVTVPYRFPYHEDPIDTLFRPNVAELISLFPGTSLVGAEIVRASARTANDRGANLFWLIIRCCVPFYHPARWKVAVKRGWEIVRGYEVTCVILRKED